MRRHPDTLKNPVKRAQYDIQRNNQSEFRSKLGGETNDRKGIQRDIDIQNKLLSILYIKRRRNVRRYRASATTSLKCSLGNIPTDTWISTFGT